MKNERDISNIEWIGIFLLLSVASFIMTPYFWVKKVSHIDANIKEL